MKNYISLGMSKLNILLDTRTLMDIEKLLIMFEIAKNHSLALNTNLLGVYPIAFTPTDREDFFKSFRVNEKLVASIIKTIPSINPNFKVASDPFNVLSIWVMHLGFEKLEELKQANNISDEEFVTIERNYFDNKTDNNTKLFTPWIGFLFHVAKILHYKFFTSIVNNSFSHGATEKYMMATINNLSRKYDIVIYGTWKKTIEARCRDLISQESIHNKNGSFNFANDDASFLYVITDVQTRMRDKLKNIAIEYYNTKEQGEAIGYTSSTTEIDDVKLLAQKVSTFDMLISSLCSELMNVNVFIDNVIMQKISTQFSNISPGMLKTALVIMSERANAQAKSHDLDKIIIDNEGNEIYVGMRALMSNIIQKSFRYCINNKVDMSNAGSIYMKIKNVYSSSRISDPEIVSVKNSIVYLVDSIGQTRRQTTKSSLRLCILTYIIVKCLKKM